MNPPARTRAREEPDGSRGHSSRPPNSPRPPTLLRMFVGVYPPPSAAVELLALPAGLPLEPNRPTAPAQLHLTAHFIGPVDPRRLDEAVESFERSCAGLRAFDLVPIRLITLPHRGWPRLLALETDAPAPLLELHTRLVTRFARPRNRRGRGASAGEHEPDRFLPHMTLCRFLDGSHQERVDATVRAPAFRVDRVHLMRSVLPPSGAVHTPAAVVELDS